MLLVLSGIAVCCLVWVLGPAVSLVAAVAAVLARFAGGQVCFSSCSGCFFALGLVPALAGDAEVCCCWLFACRISRRHVRVVWVFWCAAYIRPLLYFCRSFREFWECLTPSCR